MLATVIEHAALGAIFASTGACLRGRCAHFHHRLLFGAVAVLVEAVVMVVLVG